MIDDMEAELTEAFKINSKSDNLAVTEARNYIFGLIWRRYGPKWDILNFWGKIIFCLLSYYILSKDKFL